MKKLTLLFMTSLLLSACGLSQEKMIAGWTFPDNALAADTGVNVNLTQGIITVGGTSAIELKNGFTTKAAQASGWNDGMDEKGWVVSLNTLGFWNLNISSRQQSGGTDPGPKFFKLQYSADGGTSWNDLDDGDITVENDWETSLVDQLPLPESCENLELLMIRWLMASNEASGAGGNVLEIGKSKIDEIYVRGELINSIADQKGPGFRLMAGSHGRSVLIEARESMKQVMVTSLSGQVLTRLNVSSDRLEIDLSACKPGQVIILSVLFQNGTGISGCKYVLN